MWIEIIRPEYAHEAQRYASDLTDAEWALFEPHMPAVKHSGRPRGNLYDSRDIETAAQRVSRRRSRAPKRGSISPSARLLTRRLA